MKLNESCTYAKHCTYRAAKNNTEIHANLSWQLHPVIISYINAYKMQANCRRGWNSQLFKDLGRAKIVPPRNKHITSCHLKQQQVRLRRTEHHEALREHLSLSVFAALFLYLFFCECVCVYRTSYRVVELFHSSAFVFFLFIFFTPSAYFGENWMNFPAIKCSQITMNMKRTAREEPFYWTSSGGQQSGPISTSMLMWELDVTLKNQRDYSSPAQWWCQVLLGFTHSTRHLLHDEDFIVDFQSKSPISPLFITLSIPMRKE